MDTLTVSEVFRSIQGESTWAGLPCTFVRLTGCNLRCPYCDTAYAYEGGEPWSVDAIVRRCLELGAGLAEITGGEPLLQESCPALARALLDTGYTVLVETNGTMPIEVLPADAIKIMDLKCPGSGASEATLWSNVDALSPRDEVKFVIRDRADFEWSCGIVRKYDLDARCHAVLMSAVHGALEPKVLAAWILDERLPVRMQLQLHKYIWPAEMRGV